MTQRIDWLGLKWDHKDEGALYGTDLGPLYIYYGCVAQDSCRIPISGNRICPWLFSLTLEPFSSYCLALSSLDVRICVWSYCRFLCQIWVLSLEGLFSEGKWGGGESERKERKKRWSESCSHDERINRSRKKQTPQNLCRLTWIYTHISVLPPIPKNPILINFEVCFFLKWRDS